MNSVLSAEPQSAGRARRLVVAELHRCGFDSLSDIAELLTSELVTNALIHARSGVSVTVRAHSRGVRISVGDEDRLPVPERSRQGAPDAATGRGLALVEALADRWGQEQTADGKVVWFELEAP